MSIKKLAVLTSGGDAPGMNAMLYAIAKYSSKLNIVPMGIYEGFSGICSPTILAKELSVKELEPFRIKGGTWLGTSRCLEFLDPSVQQQAVEKLRSLEIERLLVLGGEGSYQGARALSQHGFPVICLPASIDNDVPATEIAVGFFSALQAILDALENLKVTASAHGRIFLVEVMGNHCGDLARFSGLLGPCLHTIARPENFSKEGLISKLKHHLNSGERSALVCIAEKICAVHDLAEEIEHNLEHETRALVLGHLQRGEDANVMDRFFGTQLGGFAIERAMASKAPFEMLGVVSGRMSFTSQLKERENSNPKELQASFLSYARGLADAIT